MGTKSPLGVLHPRLPGAPLEERRDWRVERRETPEKGERSTLLSELRDRRERLAWEGRRRREVKLDVVRSARSMMREERCNLAILGCFARVVVVL